VPTNEQRRATAKRKLERQLERRAAKERKRRMVIIAGSTVAAIVVIGAIVAMILITNRHSGSQSASAPTTPTTATSAAPSGPGQLPAFTAPANLGANCQYPASSEKASKPVKPPRTGNVPTDPAQVSASMATNQGNIGLQL
jgi:peptidyl-prolyl cis-trans isomerase B (cyclophilin B)